MENKREELFCLIKSTQLIQVKGTRRRYDHIIKMLYKKILRINSRKNEKNKVKASKNNKEDSGH